MQYFKIGKNAIHIVWAINDINGNPRDLSRLIPSVFYACGGGRVEAQYVEVKENIISWTFPAREQKIAGTYALSLVLKNLDGTEYSRLYRAEAFTLTPLRANDTIMAVQTESEQTIYLTACMTLADTSNKADLFYVDNRLEQVETNAREYADAAVAGHIVIFDGTNSFTEIKDAIQRDIPIIGRFPAGTNIGGITIDTTQIAAATTKMDDFDVISLRFVFSDGSSFFQATYDAFETDETLWRVDSDYLATRDDLANKAEVFILTLDSSLKEVQNAYNKGYLIATYWHHIDKGTNVILFASSVMLDNDLGLEDFRPTILFNLIEDNGYVTEIYYKWDIYEEYWQDEWNQYKIPKSNEVVNLTGYQTITGEKKFSGGINLNGTRISKVGSPVNTDDAANKQYVDDATGNIVNIEDNVEALQYNVDEIYGRLEQYQLGIAYDDYQSFLNAARYIIDDWPVGQNIYIRQLDVPDLWVSKVFRNVDDVREYTYTTDEQFIQDVRNGVQIWHHQFSLLETAKVDLSDTATKTEVNELKKTVGTKADVVDISNYLTEGAVLPYPAAYRYALNVPHMLSFRKYGAPGTPEEWYIVFCSTHIYPSEYNGYEYLFYKRDKNDNQYKFFKRVNHGDHSDDEWYKLGATVFNEDLRENKQDKLTDEQIANIAAVPNKVDIVEISSINNEGSAGTRFPFPAMYSYYGGTLPYAAQFSLNEGEGSVSYIVLCLWHTTGGYPAAGQYALFRRSDSDIRPAYIEFLRYVGPNDEWYSICQAQFHDDLPAKVTALQAEVAALKAIINEITTKE